MISNIDFIVGLMRENTNSLGFIPSTTIEKQYIANQRYIIQRDCKGRAVGYLIHGALRYGRSVPITQHCIQYEKRLSGFGILAFQELLCRARRAGSSAITLRVGEDLEAFKFWQAIGFHIHSAMPGGISRNRTIIKMYYPLHPLFESAYWDDRTTRQE